MSVLVCSPSEVNDVHFKLVQLTEHVSSSNLLKPESGSCDVLGSLQMHLAELQPHQVPQHELPTLLDSLAGVFNAVVVQLVMPTQTPDYTQPMQASLRLLEGVAAWLDQHAAALQAAAGPLLCLPLTKLLGHTLELGRHALVDPVLVEVVGSAAYKTTAEGVRSSLAKLWSFTCLLVETCWQEVQAAAQSGQAVGQEQQLEACRQLLAALLGGMLAIGAQAQSNMSMRELPVDIKNFTTINCVWKGLVEVLCRKMATIDAHWTVVPEASVGAVLDTCLSIFLAELKLFCDSKTAGELTRRTRIVTFWVANASKFIMRYPACSTSAWHKLTEAGLFLFDRLSRPEPQFPDAQDSSTSAHAWLRKEVVPRLAASTAYMLDSLGARADVSTEGPGDQGLSAITANLQSITGSDSPLDPSSAPPDQPPLPARVLLALEVVEASCRDGSMRAATLLALSRTLMPWTMRAIAGGLYDQVVQSCCQPGSLPVRAQSAALQLWAACFMAYSSALQQGAGAGGGEDGEMMEETAWTECHMQLCIMGTSSHPLLAHMASSVLCAVIGRSEPQCAQQQLLAVSQLITDLSAAAVAAACAAEVCQGPTAQVAGGAADCGDVGAEAAYKAALRQLARAVALLARLVKVSPSQAVARAYEDLQLASPRCAATNTPDAAAACASAHLWQAFGLSSVSGGGGQRVDPVGQAQELKQRVLELQEQVKQLHPLARGELPAHHSGPGAVAGGVCLAPPAATAATVHLFWVLHCLSVSVGQSKELGAKEPGAMQVSGLHDVLTMAALLACDIIGTAAAASSGSQPPSYVIPPLQVLFHCGDQVAPRTLSALQEPLTALQAASPACAVHVAAAARHMGAVEPLPVALYHALLRSPHVPVAHEALASLEALCRVAPRSEALRQLLPPDLQAPQARGAFVEAFTCYLKSCPQPDIARRAEQQAPAALAAERAALLPLLPAQAPGARGAAGSSGGGSASGREVDAGGGSGSSGYWRANAAALEAALSRGLELLHAAAAAAAECKQRAASGGWDAAAAAAGGAQGFPHSQQHPGHHPGPQGQGGQQNTLLGASAAEMNRHIASARALHGQMQACVHRLRAGVADGSVSAAEHGRLREVATRLGGELASVVSQLRGVGALLAELTEQ